MPLLRALACLLLLPWPAAAQAIPPGIPAAAMVDYHVHVKGGLTLDDALRRSRETGITYGIVVNGGLGFPIHDDAGLEAFLGETKGKAAFTAFQAEGREWVGLFTRPTLEKFDYIFTDSMTWSDDNGRRMRLWIAEEVGKIDDPERFMETLVARATAIFANEPIDLYVNPTFLPDQLAADYDRLWTPSRMKKIVDGLAANGIAMEINNRYRIPSAAFIRLAKQSGVKFACGTNNAGASDLGRNEYCLAMVRECRLGAGDFWTPPLEGRKAVQRRPLPPAPPTSSSPGRGSSASGQTVIRPSAVVEIMKRAADWQLAHPSSHAPYDWTQAAFYTGVMALADATGDAKYLAAMRAMGEANGWRPGLRPGHADDYAVIATYARLSQIDQDKKMLAPGLALFNFLADRPYNEPLAWGNRIETRELAWCDALFMGPPAMAAASVATGDRKYLDLANRLWWKTTDYLYDKEEDLYFRDSRFFDQREPNGRKVFWSRGNGWVLAGLARLLQDMPDDYPERPRYVALFKEMAAKVASLQGDDGYWRASLLDPGSLPNPETSGTGFFVYSLAWGINRGLLDRAAYEPHVRRGWSALERAVHPDGMLGWVQRIGDKPGATSQDTTEVYGVGAFLLAGSEVLRLVVGR